MELSITIFAKDREYRTKRIVVELDSFPDFAHTVIRTMSFMCEEILVYRDLAGQIGIVRVISRHRTRIDDFVRLVEAGTDWRLVVQDCKTGHYFGVTEEQEEQEKPEKRADNIDHPQHYQLPGLPCESIEVIRAVLGDEGFQKFCRGNALKYLIRADHKGGTEDLKKAVKYIGWEIDTREGHFSPRENAETSQSEDLLLERLKRRYGDESGHVEDHPQAGRDR